MAVDDALGVRPLSVYVRELRPELPEDAFAPARSRLALVPLYLAAIVVATIAIARGWVGWPIAIALSIAIGGCFAGMTFVAHELMHGTIVRGRRARLIVGWFTFLPFAIAPRLWTAWHGRIHHSTANHPDGSDPDGYPLLVDYQRNVGVRRFIDWFALGSRRWRGALSLVLGFTVQAMQMLVTARRRGFLSPREHRLAIAETALGIAVWTTVAVLVGAVPFVLVFVIPHVIANMVVMGYILTNHSLSPLSAVNDPLLTGLSVTSSRWLEWVTLNFGYHVEHHLFPAMSSRHARLVRALVRERWPGRYQSMPHWRALLALHRTSRVYKDAITLVDPRTGEEFPTLLPRADGRALHAARAAGAEVGDRTVAIGERA